MILLEIISQEFDLISITTLYLGKSNSSAVVREKTMLANNRATEHRKSTRAMLAPYCRPNGHGAVQVGW
jgi:hypothetical protein